MHEAARWLLGNQSCCQVTGRISASARKYWVFSCSQTTTHRNFACESVWMRSCNSNLKSCIDFNEFDVTMAREKWKKSHSKILKPFKEALRPRDHCPSLFFIEVKERRGVEQPLDLCTTHHSVLRHIPRCTGKSGSYQPSSAILSHHQRSLSASQPAPARHSNTSDPTCRQRRVEEEAKSNTSFVYVSRRTRKFCNSCNSAVA